MPKCPIGDKQRKMVNFKFGEEKRKDGIFNVGHVGQSERGTKKKI